MVKLPTFPSFPHKRSPCNCVVITSPLRQPSGSVMHIILLDISGSYWYYVRQDLQLLTTSSQQALCTSKRILHSAGLFNTKRLKEDFFATDDRFSKKNDFNFSILNNSWSLMQCIRDVTIMCCINSLFYLLTYNTR